jgi:cysteine desulfurase / selenocysteine lyase
VIGSGVGAEFNVGLHRRETPGVEAVTHLNNAGAALMPAPVLSAMTEHLELEAGLGGYEAAEAAEEALRLPYLAAAAMLGCAPEDIAVSDSATQAWSLAFYSIPFAPGDRVLVSSVEYGSNYLSLLHIARRTGAQVEVMANDEYGRVDVAALRASVDHRARAILVAHVPSHSGVVNPIAEIGAVAREVGAFYLVDACQSVGHIPIDVAEVGCDFLSGCGRKYLRGPRGTGFLYASPAAAERVEPLLIGLDGARWLGGQRYEIAPGAQRFETWEVNAVAKIGLGVALDYAVAAHLPTTWRRTAELGAHLRAGLAAIPGVAVFEREGSGDLAGIVGFTVAGHDPAAVRQALRALDINIWMSLASTACVDMEQRRLDKALRASVHYYNTVEEIDRFCAVLGDLVMGPGFDRADRCPVEAGVC